MTSRLFAAIYPKTKLSVTALSAISVILLWASPAKAGTTITQSFCPVVIAQPGEYDLATDVGPCLPGVDGVDITASNVTLHLDGHTISGTATPGTCNSSDGILVLGSPVVPSAVVRILGDGTVTNFDTGVAAYNSSGSFMKFVTVRTNCAPAFSIGVYLDSSTSMWKLEGNVVSGDSLSVSMWLFGNDNDIVRNDVNNTIALQSNDNTVINNTAHNASDGFFGGGVEAENGTNNNEIHANTTDNNVFHGIQLTTGSSNNHVSGNTSFNNGIFDLEDDNANCDSNTWDGNRFNTTNMPSCVH